MLMLKCVLFILTIHIYPTMRTNIVIDDGLLDDAIKLTGAKTKKEAVELGLRTLITLKKQENIKKFRGKLNWEDDLDQLRTDQ